MRPAQLKMENSFRFTIIIEVIQSPDRQIPNMFDPVSNASADMRPQRWKEDKCVVHDFTSSFMELQKHVTALTVL